MKLGLINTLAAQIRKINNSSRSESMKMAWAIVKSTEDAHLLTFTKKDGTIARRVVSPTWSKFYTPKGGNSNKKEGQVIFADLAKFGTQQHCIISTFQNQIHQWTEQI